MCIRDSSKGTTPWDDLHLKAGYVCQLDEIDSFTEALESIAAESEKDFKKAVESVYNYCLLYTSRCV